jgi:predicted HAD superfamily phosphohydrolase YqeG
MKKSPIVLESDKVLYVDVDNTLVLWDKDTYKPHKGHVNLIKQFKARGQKVVVWSAGGYVWALKVVKELGLEEYVDLVLSKPSWWADDLRADGVLPEVNRIYLDK